jgi:hypothetical protein
VSISLSSCQIASVKRAIASDFKELLAILSTTDCTKSALLSAVF